MSQAKKPRHRNSLPHYANFIWGENKQWHPGTDFIVHTVYPKCLISFNSQLAMFSDFETFCSKIVSIKWLDPEPLSKTYIKEFLTNAWNFLVIEEELLEQDIIDYEVDEDFNEDE